MTDHRVAVLALDGVTPMALAIPAQIFGPRPETPYRLTMCAPTSRVVTAGGLTVAVDGGLDEVRAADTVIVPGLDPQLRPLPAAVLDTLAEARDRGRRVVSICNGALVLAAAGVALFSMSTFDTDHILVRATDLDHAVKALRQSGHEVANP